MKKIILASALFLVVGCTNPTGTKELLEKQGYTNIKITGYRPWMASDNDSYSTGFEATSPTGQKVTGAVTESWMKGKTVRFD